MKINVEDYKGRKLTLYPIWHGKHIAITTTLGVVPVISIFKSII